MNRAIIYIRLSIGEETSLGLEGQELKCRAVAETHGATSIRVFSDPSCHNDTPITEREGLQPALAAIRRGDMFICYMRDRVSRDELISLTVEETVIKRKALFLSSEGEGTDQEGMNRAIMRMAHNIGSHMEVEKIRTRTKNGLLVKKLRNERYGGIPYGAMLARDGRHTLELYKGEKVPKCRGTNCAGCLNLIPNAEELAVFTIIFEKARHTTNHREIVRQLNADGVPTRKGTPWGKSQIDRITQRMPTNMTDNLSPSIV